MMMPPNLLFFFLDALHEDAVVKRSQRHARNSVFLEGSDLGCLGRAAIGDALRTERQRAIRGLTRLLAVDPMSS